MKSITKMLTVLVVSVGAVSSAFATVGYFGHIKPMAHPAKSKLVAIADIPVGFQIKIENDNPIHVYYISATYKPSNLPDYVPIYPANINPYQSSYVLPVDFLGYSYPQNFSVCFSVTRDDYEQTIPYHCETTGNTPFDAWSSSSTYKLY